MAVLTRDIFLPLSTAFAKPFLRTARAFGFSLLANMETKPEDLITTQQFLGLVSEINEWLRKDGTRCGMRVVLLQDSSIAEISLRVLPRISADMSQKSLMVDLKDQDENSVTVNLNSQ